MAKRRLQEPSVVITRFMQVIQPPRAGPGKSFFCSPDGSLLDGPDDAGP